MSLTVTSKAVGIGMLPKQSPGNLAQILLRHVKRRCLPACFALPFFCCSVQAQVGAPATVSPLLAYATVSVRPGLEEFAGKAGFTEIISATDSQSETSEPPRALNVAIWADSFTFKNEKRFSTLSRSPRHNGLLHGDEIVLFRKRMSSHYNYSSWARVDSGYGQYFNGADPIGRTCTSGAGVRDLDWLYVKMTFSF